MIILKLLKWNETKYWNNKSNWRDKYEKKILFYPHYILLDIRRNSTLQTNIKTAAFDVCKNYVGPIGA